MNGATAIKSSIPLLAFGLVACASTSTSSNEPADRCDSTDCFNQLQIRSFEVIDNQTLVVYVGSQSCPFRVQFTGPACDLTFIPGGDLVFRPDFLRAQRDTGFGINRVCSTDSNVGIDEGVFTRAAGASDADPRIACRIRDIQSLTDDEVLELYVAHKIAAPPPPFGNGELEVPGSPDETTPEQGTAVRIPEEASEAPATPADN